MPITLRDQSVGTAIKSQQVAARKGAWAFATQQEGVGRGLSRSRKSMIFPVICSSADVPDNVPESRARRQATSRMITGGRLRCTG
jgi:hypothetical protein